jgi:hypothetical protein
MGFYCFWSIYELFRQKKEWNRVGFLKRNNILTKIKMMDIVLSGVQTGRVVNSWNARCNIFISKAK